MIRRRSGRRSAAARSRRSPPTTARSRPSRRRWDARTLRRSPAASPVWRRAARWSIRRALPRGRSALRRCAACWRRTRRGFMACSRARACSPRARTPTLSSTIRRPTTSSAPKISSAARATRPMRGFVTRGGIEQVWLRGQLMVRGGSVVGECGGKFIPRGKCAL